MPFKIIPLITCLLVSLASSAYSAVFNVASGDVPGLIAAINTANSNGDDDTINVSGTYVLTTVNDPIDGGNGLPSITSSMTIDGGTGATIKRSDASETPFFRIFRVAETGNLTLNAVRIEGGSLPHTDFASEGTGAGILSSGNLTITGSAVVGNSAGDDGGGIVSGRQDSTFILRNSIISGNSAGNGQTVAGVIACCSVSISNSTISDNYGIGLSVGGLDGGTADVLSSFIFRNHGQGRVGGIIAAGQIVITNSTIAENTGGTGTLDAAAVFLHSGRLFLVNNTIVNNATPSLDPNSTGGILADPVNNGRIELVNTILAGNTRRGLASDCGGAPVTSLGNNLIGSTAGCTVSLVTTDQLGDPALGPLIDDGTPGNGHFPLLETSAAIDAANIDACPGEDQLGQSRVENCDIGSIEFQPPQPALLVSIDIRPENKANKVNLKHTKRIDVAIFSDDVFDASAVDVNTVRFGVTGSEAAPIRVHQKQLNKDRRRDLLLRFELDETGIQCGDTSASVTGKLSGGEPFAGSAPITTTGCEENLRRIM